MLLENNSLRGGKSSSASHQAAPHHLVVAYFPRTPYPEVFYSPTIANLLQEYRV